MASFTFNRKTLLDFFIILFIFIIVLEICLQLIGSLVRPQTNITTNIDDDNFIRIVALGESTTAEWYDPRRGTTWPQQLQNFFNKEKLPIEVYNRGVPGTNTSLVLKNLKKNIFDDRPHIVISMIGINDFRPLLVDNSFQTSPFKSIKLFKWFWDFLFTDLYIDSYSPKLKSDIEKLNQLYLDEYKQNRSLNKKLITSNPSLFFKQLNNVEKKMQCSFLHKSYYDSISPSGDDIEWAKKLFPKFKECWSGKDSNLYGKLTYMNIALRSRNYGDCQRASLEILRLDPPLESKSFLESMLCWDDHHNNEGHKEYQRILKRHNIKVQQDKTCCKKQNYNEIIRTLRKNNIISVAMNYPRTSKEELTKLFNKETAPHFFVNNQNNFDETLKYKEFDDLFFDRFGGSFGHMTELGHCLIAQNTLNTLAEILPKLNSTISSDKFKLSCSENDK